MTPKKFITEINNQPLTVYSYENGRCAPLANDVLNIVGLEPISSRTDEFFALLFDSNPEDMMNWVAHHAKISHTEAKLKLRSFFHLDACVRMHFAKTKQLGVDEIRYLRGDISMLETGYSFSYKEIINMLKHEGFQTNNLSTDEFISILEKEHYYSIKEIAEEFVEKND